MQPQRYQIIDLLKGIAILLMIQVHICELFASEEIYHSSLGKLSLFLGSVPVAPILMVFLGYFLFNNSKSSSHILWRGIKLFTLGMLLNILLNFNLIYSVYTNKLQINIWPYVFGVDILHFAGLSTIALFCLRKWLEKYLLVSVFLIILISTGSQFLISIEPTNSITKYISSYFFGCSNWSYFPLFPWLVYPLAGMILYQLQQKFDFRFFYLPKTKLLFGSAFLLFLVFTIKYAIDVSSNLQQYYHHGLLFFIWVILFCLFYALLIHELNTHVGESMVFKYLKWLGKHVTLIYAIQWIIIGNIATEIYKTVSSPVYLATWFLGIIFVTSGLTYLVLKLKAFSSS